MKLAGIPLYFLLLGVKTVIQDSECELKTRQEAISQTTEVTVTVTIELCQSTA